MRNLHQLLVTTIMFVAVSISIEAKPKKFGKNITWEITPNQELVVSGYGKIPDIPYKKHAPWCKNIANGEVKKIIIKNGITEIGRSSFDPWYKYKNNEKVESIEFPSSIKKIGIEAFYMMRHLVDVNLSNLKNAKIHGAFYGCEIKNIEIPSDWTEMPDGIFRSCTLNVLEIPEGVTKLSRTCFQNSTINKIILPKSLRIIEEYAFSDSKIKSITIPEGVISIGENCFEDSGIEEITLPQSINVIGKKAFKDCHKLTQIKLPNVMYEIADQAFTGCINLRSIVLPSSICKICETAFENCESLVLSEDDKKLIKKHTTQIDIPKSWNDNFNYGQNRFKANDYKSAIEAYKRAIDVDSRLQVNEYAYYNIGLCQYKMGKYKDAISSLNTCKYKTKSEELKSEAEGLIEACNAEIENERQRKAQVAAAIIGAVVATGMAMMENAQLNKYRNSGSLDYLLDPRYSYLKVQHQNRMEYLQMTNGGITMSYEDWYANIKAPAIMATYGSGSSSSPSNSSSSSSHSYSSSSNSYSNSTSGTMCKRCAGSGDCKTCDGKGFFYNPYDLTKTVACPNCESNHNGKCASCHGTGTK